MKIFLVDVKKCFDHMEFAMSDKARLESMKSELDSILQGFDSRAEGYRRTAESPILVDESVRREAVQQYHEDAEKTKAVVAAKRSEIDALVVEINSSMKRAFDAAIAQVSKLLDAHHSGDEYIVIPLESALSANLQQYPTGNVIDPSLMDYGADITDLVVRELSGVGSAAYSS
jgi:hypothetical protein